MALFKNRARLSMVILLVYLCYENEAKVSENRTDESNSSEEQPHVRSPKKAPETAALTFADEFKQTIERYLFGICPQSYKFRWLQMPKVKNITASTCDLDTDQQDLAGRLATLALRAHTAARTDCARLGVALANTLGELARTASSRQAFSAAAANNEAIKKRKLSKSQKLKIQAKQRTALAVKKKAAAVAAAAAAKLAS